jgi:SAM-dependent methyltransferase
VKPAVHWKLKAAVQNIMGRLPPNFANPVYYRLQRSFGGLRETTPLSRLAAGIEIVRRLHALRRSPESAVFLEIGTGHQLNLPLCLWLSGASQIITVDLNCYLQEQLVMSDVAYMRQHEEEVRTLFSGVSLSRLFEQRFQRIMAGVGTLRKLLSLTNIQYRAPADASHLALEADSIDYHISYTVLEHIPTPVLKRIFREGGRLLKPDGLFIHCIDFSDHFAHSDRTVSTVNFLQFSELEWDRLAGNRYMFHNRLRVDEFQELLRELNLEVLALDSKVDNAAVQVLRDGFPLDKRFQNKDFCTNAASGAWLVASPQRPA